MSALKTRIARNGRSSPRLSPVTGGKTYGGAESPASMVQIEPGVGAGIGPLSPIIAADGAPIPATGPGRWDQLVAAGRG